MSKSIKIIKTNKVNWLQANFEKLFWVELLKTARFQCKKNRRLAEKKQINTLYSCRILEINFANTRENAFSSEAHLHGAAFPWDYETFLEVRDVFSQGTNRNTFSVHKSSPCTNHQARTSKTYEHSNKIICLVLHLHLYPTQLSVYFISAPPCHQPYLILSNLNSAYSH